MTHLSSVAGLLTQNPLLHLMASTPVSSPASTCGVMDIRESHDRKYPGGGTKIKSLGTSEEPYETQVFNRRPYTASIRQSQETASQLRTVAR